MARKHHWVREVDNAGSPKGDPMPATIERGHVTVYIPGRTYPIAKAPVEYGPEIKQPGMDAKFDRDVEEVI